MVAQNQQSIKHLREMPAIDIQQAFYLIFSFTVIYKDTIITPQEWTPLG